MKAKHIIIIACAALFGATLANAQGQTLPILTANTDARTAAMGNASVAAEGMYLYNNPSALFGVDKKFTADASASVYEKEDSGYTQPLWAINLPSDTQHLLDSAMQVD